MLRSILVLLALATAQPAIGQGLPLIGGWFSDGGDAEPDPDEKPGTKAWWRKHRKQATFVPKQGWRVEGYEGYFDANGRPIDAPVDEITVQLTADLEEDEGLIPGISPDKTAERVREAIGLGPNQREAQEFLNEGVRLFNEDKHDRAAKRFERAAARWPGSALEAQALFNLGEARFFDEKYEEAADAYIELISKHGSTPRLNDAVERLWEIAQYWEKSHFARDRRPPLDLNLTGRTRPTTDTVGHAIRLYEAIRLNDPTGPRADDAIMATAGIYFRRGRHHDADYHYGLLRSEYPRSEHQFEAHLLGLQAKLRKYQGPDYDGTPLREAKKLEERLRLVFAGRLSEEERTRLQTTRGQLAAMVEERDLRMADYYLGTEHNASAKVYLSRILQEHPDTPAAKLAAEQLAEIDGLPGSPDPPMGWFVGLFPKNPEQAAIDEISERTPASLSPDADVTRIAEADEGDATTTR